VACTRGRDLLILPSIPQAAKDSWFSSINLRQNEIPEIDLSAFPEPTARPAPSSKNEQSADVFAAEQRRIDEKATPIVWRRPSDHDPDRLGDPLESVVIAEAVAEHPDIVGAGALRGIILHKLVEELLTGELVSTRKAATARADVLLSQLVSGGGDDGPRPEPLEMAGTALRTLALPEIAVLKPYLVPELAIWAARDTYLVAGRADALAIRENKIDVAIDWKSDVKPTMSVRAAYADQLRNYLEATGAARGALVFMSLNEVVWVNPAI
jgi:CRISPR-associated exonuclease Cas4